MTETSISPLDSIDKKFLKDEIKQVLAIYLLILLIGSILLSVGYIFIKKENIGGANNWLILTIYLLTSICLYFCFLMKHFNGPFKDFSSKDKKVKQGFVQEKSNNANYGWSGNVVADMTSQPKLVEHFVTINNVKYFVNEEDFNKVNKGDKVELHFSFSMNKLMRIEKV